MNLIDGQYVFANQTNTFEENLAAACEFCQNDSSNAVSAEESSAITPFIDALAATYDEVNESNPEIELSVTSTDNCITYGNVVLVPTIINDDNQQQNAQIKIEHNINQCILSSDSTFLNSFLQAPNIDVDNVLCGGDDTTTPTQEANDAAIAIDTYGISMESNQQSQSQMYQIVNSNHVNIEMPSVIEPEMLLQDEHGQFYRPVPNIFNVNGTTELLPIITTYDGTYQPTTNEPTPSYEIPVNFISTSNSSDTASDAVQLIFDGYGNGGADVADVGTNQFQIDPNAAQDTNYQTQFQLDANKEQQSLFESISLTLRKNFFFGFCLRFSLEFYFVFKFFFRQWLR